MPGKPDPTSLLVDEGPPYTRGRGFRARAEARQRRFRSQVLRCGFARYGHVLSPDAADAGLNFIHPAALSAARRRAGRGRGIHVPRLFANLCSSQAMGFNLFGPLAQGSGLKIASTVLRRYIEDLSMVLRIQFAHRPPPEIFRDPFGAAGTSTDLLIDYTTTRGDSALLSMEIKFTEERFEHCAMHASGIRVPCHVDLTIADPSSGCRHVSQKGFACWERTIQLQTLQPPVTRTGHCPFSGSLWQLWVHHTLAQALGTRQRSTRVIHAVCAPPGNETLQAAAHVAQFANLLNDPSSIRLIPLESLIDNLHDAIPDSPTWHDWISKARARYLID